MGSLAEKKIKLQSKGVKLNAELEEKLRKKYSSAVSDYMSFMMQNIPVGILNGVYTDASPFEIKKIGKDKFAIFENEEFFSEIEFLPRPKFFGRKTSTGIKMERMCKLIAPGFPIIYLSTGCVYWGAKQCKFCVTGYIDTIKEKKPEEVAEVVEAGVREGAIKTHVALTCGALQKDRGSELLFLAAKAIKERVDIPVSVNVEPPRDLNWINKLAEADSIYINLEVFDEKTRREILPGKSAFNVGYYDKVYKRCLEVFDENQVGSVLLAGLESDETYLKGVEHLASLGVIPVVVPFYPAMLSKLNERTPPDAERMEKIYRAAAEIIKSYGLNPFKTKAGFMRGGALFALREVMQGI